jgi:cytochrome c oxidase assembly protein Cox11
MMTYSRYRHILNKNHQYRTFFKKAVRPPRTTDEKNKTTLFYLASLAVGTVGASYAAVPLYRAFCQSTGYGGTVKEGHDIEKVETMEKKEDRLLTIRFNADTAAQMRWNFRPQQNTVYVHPGETALAFYTARNPTDKPIDGVSTYNVIPFEAGPYFNKIQCFCFEEQRLNPGEEVGVFSLCNVIILPLPPHSSLRLINVQHQTEPQ